MSLEGAALVQWVVASNRSYLAPLADDQRIAAFGTPFQYLLISAPPERERRFQELKAQSGSTFAFHGSGAENWHSILRNGLKNASGTQLQVTGAAHGPGIYLATDSATSLGYASRGARIFLGDEHVPGKLPELKRQKTGNRFLENVDTITMLAVCEVINDPCIKKVGRIWVVPKEEIVCTRFFLCYSERTQFHNVDIEKHINAIQACMTKLNVGAPR